MTIEPEQFYLLVACVLVEGIVCARLLWRITQVSKRINYYLSLGLTERQRYQVLDAIYFHSIWPMRAQPQEPIEDFYRGY